MATIYPLKPRELFEVPKSDKVTVCKMCLELAVPSDGIDLGPLYQYGHPVDNDSDIEVYSAHYFCLLFAPGLQTNGEDDEGIKGFLPADILKEWRRGQRLKCSFCTKSYATVGCFGKSCKKAYHLPCGIRNGSHQEFCDPFSSYCHEHRPEQKVYKDKSVANLPRECGMCFDDINPIKKVRPEDRKKSIWTPCCGKWFHFKCVQRMAYTAGYFFKCPLCNNKDEFEQEMKLFGVYVPEQDAAWEREGNMFDAIYERHGSCDAEECSCPDGREFDEDYTIWEIILCKYCGSQGVHVKCGNLPLTDDVTWKCSFCFEVVKKMPPRTKHNFRKINQKKSSRKGVLQKLLSRSSFHVTNGHITLASNVAHASVQVCPKYEIPLPVKLGSPDPVKEIVEELIKGKVEFNPILMLTPVKHASPAAKIATPTKNVSSPIKTPTKVGSSPIRMSTPVPSSELSLSPKKKQQGLKRKLLQDNHDTQDILVIKDKLCCREESLAKLKQNSILNYFCAKNT